MTTQDPTPVIAAIAISLLLGAALYVWTALALAAVFGKSGRERWKAWVPFLNIFVLLELGGLSGWLVLLAFVPGIGSVALWVVIVVACHRVGRSFGFGAGMTVLAALVLPVWASVVGFGSARWLGAAAGPARGPARARSTAVPPPPAPRAPAARPAAAPAAPPVVPAAPPAPVAAAAPAPAAPAPAPAPTPAPAPAVAAAAVAAGDAADEPVPDADPAPVAAAAAEPLAATPASARRAEPWTDLDTDVDTAGEMTGGVSDAPAPIAAVPGRSDEPAPAPARTAAVTHVPPMAARETAEPWAPSDAAPATAPSRIVAEPFPEESDEVSAIAAAPVADGPRSARSSVSAQHVRPEIPDDEFERTEIARRRRVRWSLTVPSGESIPLTADVVIIGRRPTPSSAFPGAQLVPIPDGTISKTHARLQRDGALWHIVDLGSTNGTVLIGSDGGETEIEPGSLHPLPARFLVGDAEVSLVSDESGRDAD
ncbi:DUF5684 domain-containing protein [Microbacter sp. GSS18]|nr:DUF5684 domain-containing protein [Microbacter sp. GSS18]